MQKITSLSATLNGLRATSLDISKQMLPVLQELQDEASEYVDEFLDLSSTTDRSVALALIRKVAVQIPEDASIINEEIDFFAEAVMGGNDEIEGRSDDYPFLYSVWGGDVYDEVEVEALKMLLRDLKTQLISINKDGEDYIVSEAVKLLPPKVEEVVPSVEVAETPE